MLDQYVVVKAIQEVASKPSKSFSVRGLAASIGISPAASRMALEFMKKKGIATLTVIGKTYQYKANLENALCRQWKILFNLDLLADAKIVEHIIEKIPSIQSVLLYGSFAKGVNDEKSDIDLLVVSLKQGRIDSKLAGKINKEVNLSVMTLHDWKLKAVQDKVFYENVIFDSIVLHGDSRPVVL